MMMMMKKKKKRMNLPLSSVNAGGVCRVAVDTTTNGSFTY
jgi:hypothetical protein